MKRSPALIFAFALLLALGGCGGSSNNSSADASERIAAPELHRAYKADLRKAEETYKGKNLTVTGTAHSFRDEALGGKRLQILTYGEGTDTFAVTCTSNDPQWNADVANVRLSQAVTFSGTLTRFGDKSAEFSNCRIVK